MRIPEFKRLLPALLLAGVTAIYLPSLRNGFVYDDIVLIVEESRPESLADYLRVFREWHFPTVPYYRPVTRLTFLAQKHLHDLDPAPYHLLNALLGGLAAAAAFVLLRGPGLRVPAYAAAGAALLWGAHPAMSSCVYPICSGRETLLPTIIMLLAVAAWNRKGARWGAAAVGLAVTALFAREQAVVLPVIFLVSDLLNLSGEGRSRLGFLGGAGNLAGIPGRKAIFKAVPWRYAALGVAGLFYLAVRRMLFGGTEYELALPEAPLMPLYSYLYALQTAFFPFFELVYEPPLAIWWSRGRAASAAVLGGGLALAAWKLGLRRQLLFWAGWFVIVQAPTAHILKQEAPFDERYILLAGLALPALGAAVYGALPPLPGTVRTAARTLCLGLAVLFSGISLYRGRFFRDEHVFIEHWLATNPRSVNAILLHSKRMIDEGDYKAGYRYGARAVDLDPGMASAWSALGLAGFHLEDWDIAIASYERALELDSKEGVHYNLALALERSGQPERAREYYRTAIERGIDKGKALYNLGLLLARSGEPGEALPLFERAFRAEPENTAALYNRGVALEDLRRWDEAMAAYLSVLEHAPRHTDALFNLGSLHYRAENFDEAVRYFGRLVEIDPEDQQARINLAGALEMQRIRAAAPQTPPSGP